MNKESRNVRVSAIQTSLSQDTKKNIEKLDQWVTKAAEDGAQVILMSELFESHYFCKEEKDELFALAHELEGHPTILHYQKLAKALNVVLPVSFFERANHAHYNSVAMIDATGEILGVYRKSHIPDGPGYEEKFYFRPGDTGFKVWNTKFAKIGVGICWDQWYPECARAMALQGAELLFYPTAIGSEPANPSLDTKDPWQRSMQGHAIASVIPVIAANRTGIEGEQSFYGHSFIADQLGKIVCEIQNSEEGFISHTFDLNAIARTRASWGFFRDRRPELYGALLSADGRPREF
jgi:N-carbamoylputrescine amidase